MWHFFCASLQAFISALNIACCAPFDELLCVWRWIWCCWGGAELVAVGHGWEGGYFNYQMGQSSPLLQTHTWLSSLQVCSTLFSLSTLKHNEREDSSLQSGCQLPLACCSVRECLSANYISTQQSHICANLLTTDRGLESEIIAHAHTIKWY